jgi:ribosomal protein S18 acetylase RimI-like enzyme
MGIETPKFNDTSKQEKSPSEGKQVSENLEDKIEFVSHVGNIKRIIIDGKRVGVFSCKDNGDYYSISYITIDDELRGQGLGKKIYKKLADSLDKPLRSDLELSDLAENVWKKFVNQGLAKQIGTIPSGKGWYEWIK